MHTITKAITAITIVLSTFAVAAGCTPSSDQPQRPSPSTEPATDIPSYTQADAAAAFEALTPLERADICQMYWSTSDADLIEFAVNDGFYREHAIILIDEFASSC